MIYTRYSAFISSNYQSLKKIRAEIINCLLDARMIPICMEHFIVPSDDNFSYIQELINQSDIFIMILGDVYGSTDDNKVSWTRREYEYAQRIKKTCYVIKTPSYNQLLSRSNKKEELSEDEKKQLQFGESIQFAYCIKNRDVKTSVSNIVQRIVSDPQIGQCLGWKRGDSEIFIRNWQQKNKFLNLAGKWYHVHLKENDQKYIRIGDVDITQNFQPYHYVNLRFDAQNYNVKRIDSKTREIVYDHSKITIWNGDYQIKENNSIIGVYTAHRLFSDSFGKYMIEKGVCMGIHRLTIVDDDNDQDTTDETIMLEGTFHDAYPAQKTGLLFMFRTKEARYQFLQENFKYLFGSKL